MNGGWSQNKDSAVLETQRKSAKTEVKGGPAAVHALNGKAGRCAILDGNLSGEGGFSEPFQGCFRPLEIESIKNRTHSRIRSTTVICVRRNGQVVMAADGQVTLQDHVLKHSAKKIRRLYQDKILAGFAGSTADAFNLFPALRNQARAVCRQPEPGRGGAGQGLAYR